MLGDSREWGGNGSSSAMGEVVLPSGGGNVSATGCTMAPPPVSVFPMPSTIESFIKRLKVMVAQ